MDVTGITQVQVCSCDNNTLIAQFVTWVMIKHSAVPTVLGKRSHRGKEVESYRDMSNLWCDQCESQSLGQTRPIISWVLFTLGQTADGSGEKPPVRFRTCTQFVQVHRAGRAGRGGEEVLIQVSFLSCIIRWTDPVELGSSSVGSVQKMSLVSFVSMVTISWSVCRWHHQSLCLRWHHQRPLSVTTQETTALSLHPPPSSSSSSAWSSPVRGQWPLTSSLPKVRSETSWEPVKWLSLVICVTELNVKLWAAAALEKPKPDVSCDKEKQLIHQRLSDVRGDAAGNTWFRVSVTE